MKYRQVDNIGFLLYVMIVLVWPLTRDYWIPVTGQFLPNFHFENFVFETKEDCIYYVKKTFDIYMRFCILDGSLDLNDSDIVATHRVWQKLKWRLFSLLQKFLSSLNFCLIRYRFEAESSSLLSSLRWNGLNIFCKIA